MTYSRYLRLNLHVADSDVAVIKAARKMVAKEHRTSREMRGVRHNFYRSMISHHQQARNLYRDVMLGQLDGE